MILLLLVGDQHGMGRRWTREYTPAPVLSCLDDAGQLTPTWARGITAVTLERMHCELAERPVTEGSARDQRDAVHPVASARSSPPSFPSLTVLTLEPTLPWRIDCSFSEKKIQSGNDWHQRRIQLTLSHCR
ncbi:MAG: hypothetical protein E6J90_25140 [Deltaproteobacteria bacterium]|nr:MAG: hypothetical protein E6J90_25140 [Deltaproteobacteria bacterium]